MSNLPGDVVGGNAASDVGKIPGDVVNVGAQSNAFAEFVRSQEFAAILQEQYRTNWGAPVPVGGIVPFAGTAAPTDWLVCDGTSYARSLYPDLAAVLVPGTFGGDTSSFVVPDLRGRTVVGTGTGSGLSARALAATGGAEDAVVVTHDHGGYTGYDNPRHTHTMPPGGAHRHALGVRFGADGDSSVRNGVREANAAADSAEGVRTTESAHSHTINDTDINHRHTIASAGESGTGKNMPPFYVLNYIVRAR